MNEITFSENDVISFIENKPFGLSRTVKFDEFQAEIKNHISNHYQNNKELLYSGVDCELLQLGSKQWGKGKVKIRVHFIPEVESIKTSSSDLDEFRSED